MFIRQNPIDVSATTLITADELARLFGVTVPTVNRWVRRGLIPCVRVTRKVVRFDISKVRDALADRAATKAESAPPTPGDSKSNESAERKARDGRAK